MLINFSIDVLLWLNPASIHIDTCISGKQELWIANELCEYNCVCMFCCCCCYWWWWSNRFVRALVWLWFDLDFDDSFLCSVLLLMRLMLMWCYFFNFFDCEQTHFKQSENHEAHLSTYHCVPLGVHIAVAICKTGTKKFWRNEQTFSEAKSTFALERRRKNKRKRKWDSVTESIVWDGVWVQWVQKQE